MSKKFQFSSELERNNRLAMNTHLCEVVIISILCFLQAWNGERSWVYAIVLSVIGFAPVIAERIFWKKDHETQAIYHLLAIGFAVYYTCLIFTATTSAIYAFVLPLVLVASIYNDIRYMLLINAGVVIENVLAVIIGATTGRLGYAGQDSAVIQILITVMIGIFALFLAKVSKANSDQKLQKLEESHLKSDELLKNISEMSEKMQTGINEIYNELAKLNEAGKATQSTAGFALILLNRPKEAGDSGDSALTYTQNPVLMRIRLAISLLILLIPDIYYIGVTSGFLKNMQP